MGVWETEDESGAPALTTSLPTPTDTPYRTPSRTSKRSRRSATPPGKSPSPVPLPGERTEKSSKRSSRDVSGEESISVLDPRRFTPTLHANLVGEILALRRDQEEKIKVIENLEVSLHASKQEQEAVQSSLLGTAKENRSLKRQLALLEGGTSSALGELARERDEAVDSINETKKRLDTAQKKLRSQEHDTEQLQASWQRQKEAWEEEKRKFERKVHVAETRLKTVLEEVAAYQAAQANNLQESEQEDHSKDNDAASTRTMSMTNSIRFSMLNGGQVVKPNGHSLADELNFESDDDYDALPGGRESVLSHHRHLRNPSRDSAMSIQHQRQPSNESPVRPGSVARGRFLWNQSALGQLEGRVIKEDDEYQQSVTKPSYTDTGIQFSPPPSPKIVPAKPLTPEPSLTFRMDKAQETESPSRGDWEIEANQRRKRVHATRPLIIEPASAQKAMVNGSSQTTTEHPPSPPKTPKSGLEPSPSMRTKVLSAMVSTSTQTDTPPSPPRQSLMPVYQMQIPSISIHPPTSRPTTPREPRLPQLFKDFGCQVSLNTPLPSKSIAVQTEEIRVDTRLDRLPIHLHPSAITSRPPSPGETDMSLLDEGKSFTPLPGQLPPRNPRRLASKRSVGDNASSPPPAANSPETNTRDAYPGNNDNGPLSTYKAPMRRPHRISSLFAGFDGASSDEVDEFGDADLSDTEYRTALSAPKPKGGSSRPTKRGSAGSNATPSEGTTRLSGGRGYVKSTGPEVYNTYALPERRDSKDAMVNRSSFMGLGRSSDRAVGAGANKSAVMRKAAMIQSGIASHQGRPRSPSVPESREPPFPIPTRASSRRPPISASAPSDGRRSPTRQSDGWHRRGGRSHYRVSSIRKVRSAAALPRGHPKNRRLGSRSPPPASPSTEALESPTLPPLPSDSITGFRNSGMYRVHQTKNSTNTAHTGDTGIGSQSSSNPGTGVVDAIAQTMIGEWMFKYVRRRKSFGVPDVKGDDSSNDRHKRWVWLAPYERAILWSSKQPTSGTALMGKPGRKLIIQSVLDVKDDNASPKGVTQLFNRSILILTPQRALKFTAVNAERHYVWLTALSFLAHSSQAVPEIVGVQPQVQQVVPDFELPQTKAKRAGIRDSIRLAKNKSSLPRSPPGPMSIASSITSDMPASIASFRPPLPDTFVSMPAIGTVTEHQREHSREAAEPPFVPRFQERERMSSSIVGPMATAHGRKRSNTGGHVPPPLSFRGFSGPVSTSSGSQGYHAATNSTAAASIATAGSSDIWQSHTSGSNGGAWGVLSNAGGSSHRTSEASSHAPFGLNRQSNFFDAIGTVRMEAFISPLSSAADGGQYPNEHEELRNLARRRSKEMRRRHSRSRQRDSYQSRGTRGTATTDEYYAGGGGGASRNPGEEDYYYFRDDPFKGF